MKIQIIKCLQDNYSYLIIDEKNLTACVVDPSESKPIIDFVENNNINLKYILNTHHHFDHVGGNKELKKRYNSNFYNESRSIKLHNFYSNNHSIKVHSSKKLKLIIKISLYSISICDQRPWSEQPFNKGCQLDHQVFKEATVTGSKKEIPNKINRVEPYACSIPSMVVGVGPSILSIPLFLL